MRPRDLAARSAQRVGEDRLDALEGGAIARLRLLVALHGGDDAFDAAGEAAGARRLRRAAGPTLQRQASLRRLGARHLALATRRLLDNAEQRLRAAEHDRVDLQALLRGGFGDVAILGAAVALQTVDDEV